MWTHELFVLLFNSCAEIPNFIVSVGNSAIILHKYRNTWDLDPKTQMQLLHSTLHDVSVYCYNSIMVASNFYHSFELYRVATEATDEKIEIIRALTDEDPHISIRYIVF